MSSTPTAIWKAFSTEYKKTPMRVKIIDLFIIYAIATAAIQFLYMLLVGTFPFNAFLAGFLSSVGFLALTVCLRMQVDPANKDQFRNISPERAFADYVLANLVLHLVVFNYVG